MMEERNITSTGSSSFNGPEGPSIEKAMVLAKAIIVEDRW
jgi:hypothetical protein